METITSTSNQFAKLAKSLAEKKFRDESGCFLAEGANLLKDMPSGQAVEFFLVEEGKEQEFCSITNRFEAPVLTVTAHVLKSVSDTVTPQGIVAVLKKRENGFQLPKGNALVLDGVSDAGNLGTILRTAAACDFKQIYLLDCADVYSPKVVRASMSGLFKVDCKAVSETEALSVLENSESFALDMDGENMLGLKTVSPLTLVGGSEAHGVRESVRKAVKRVVSLPMKNDMESLNVAVALAVAMYQTVSQI